MPRGLYNWKAEQVIRFLKKYNFVNTHNRGSHFYYLGSYRGETRLVCIPIHSGTALKPRTLKSIIIQSGIPKDKWLEPKV